MQLMNTVFLLISLLINRIDSELKIINRIFNFNLKQNKIVLKYQNINSLNSIIVPKFTKNSFFQTNSQIRNIKTSDSEANKSNANLILKNNNSISNKIVIPFSDNDERKIKNIKINKKNFTTLVGIKTRSNYYNLNLNQNKENKNINIENSNNIILPVNDRKINKH